jgi:hypothetical protein
MSGTTTLDHHGAGASTRDTKPTHNKEPTQLAGAAEAGSAKRMEAAEAGVHPMVAKIAIGAAIWFLVATWLFFAWGRQVDFLIAIVILFFVFFLGLFLLTASFSAKDPRWPVRETSFRNFLGSDVRIGSGTMRGRDVVIQIATIPVALALAATLIGLAWVIFG